MAKNPKLQGVKPWNAKDDTSIPKSRRDGRSVEGYGEFDWRKHGRNGNGFGAAIKNQCATEEEYMALLKPSRLKEYLRDRESRYQRWYHGRKRQRWLRTMRKNIDRQDREKVKLMTKRFKPIRWSETIVPAEINALMSIATYLQDNQSPP